MTRNIGARPSRTTSPHEAAAPDSAASAKTREKRRMAFMPYLYFSAKPEVRAWAYEWQQEVHAQLRMLEAVELDPSCFVAEDADVFAEPMRKVVVQEGASIAAHAFVHGPVTLGAHVSVNPYVTLDGGQSVGTAYQRVPYGAFGRQLYGQTNPDARGMLFVEPEKLYSRSKNTPFGGWELKGAPVATVVDGKVLMRDGEVLDGKR